MIYFYLLFFLYNKVIQIQFLIFPKFAQCYYFFPNTFCIRTGIEKQKLFGYFSALIAQSCKNKYFPRVKFQKNKFIINPLKIYLAKIYEWIF